MVSTSCIAGVVAAKCSKFRYSTDTAEPTPIFQNAYTKKHSPRKQLRRHLIEGFKRCMITLVLESFLFGTIYGFSKYDVMTAAELAWYNSLVTGLNIAINLRWWFLSRERRSLRDVDEILECSSLRYVTRYAVHLIKKEQLLLASICIFRVLVNTGAQAGVAMLALTFSLVPSNVALGPVIGSVYFTNCSQPFSNVFVDETLLASQYCAHTFGGFGQHFNLNFSNSSPPMNLPVQPFTLYADDTTDYWEFKTYFQYVFMESPADSSSIIGNFYSNRSITTSSLREVFPVIEDLNLSPSTFHYVENGTAQEIQFQNLIPASNTYYTFPSVQDCGSRCATSFYYKCHVNVSDVANATVLQHNVSDTNARIAAGAIALQGYQAQDEFNQSQTFPSSQSIYGLELLRKFAIGVFVASDNVLPNVANPFHQLLPGQGLMLSLDNLPGMLSILGTLLAVHCLLVIIGSFIANKKIEEPSVVYCDTVCGKGSGVRSVASSKEDESVVLWDFDCDL
ncbi:hypothetical protein V8E51_010017 [Hyaloscypha variabilis]